MSRMVVGTLNLRLAVFAAASLKDKRRVVRSLKDRIRGRFNVSIAEVGALDRHQQAELGVALIGNDGTYVESSLDKIVDYVRRDRAASLVDYEVELF